MNPISVTLVFLLACETDWNVVFVKLPPKVVQCYFTNIPETAASALVTSDQNGQTLIFRKDVRLAKTESLVGDPSDWKSVLPIKDSLFVVSGEYVPTNIPPATTVLSSSSHVFDPSLNSLKVLPLQAPDRLISAVGTSDGALWGIVRSKPGFEVLRLTKESVGVAMDLPAIGGSCKCQIYSKGNSIAVLTSNDEGRIVLNLPNGRTSELQGKMLGIPCKLHDGDTLRYICIRQTTDSRRMVFDPFEPNSQYEIVGPFSPRQQRLLGILKISEQLIVAVMRRDNLEVVMGDGLGNWTRLGIQNIGRENISHVQFQTIGNDLLVVPIPIKAGVRELR